ncbi:CPBP family intramembrane metalloprotease [Olleya sp. YS]|uniref:CPBP family intramembrane glutamic endopeptidase n=1 Tax=Olleya sp. YS TaxID=3028318 RepID=UPI0024345816|nr:CPBP family intramembrane metalloprotease [Olleya sp. YS]WGD35059.1 CPBP family intramembrane metalloprotease [Olleya sp. YS]
MKKVWQKTPALLKALLLNIVLLYPIVTINQIIIQLNLKYFPKYGISLIPILIILYLYWKVITKWNPYINKDDIKLSFKFNIVNIKNILIVLGLGLFTVITIYFSYIFFDIDNSPQLGYIKSFSNNNIITAIPLLLGLALTAGIAEEVTYRGFIQNTTHRKYSKIISYLIIGILFSIAHFLPLELIAPYILISIAYSFIADKQKSTGLVIFTHFLSDFALFLLIYFNVIS